MVGLLTWPTYGTRFPGHGRGWIDRNRQQPARSIPEPVWTVPTQQPDPMKWLTVRLNDDQRRLIVDDLSRIASLRRFKLHVVVVAENHVHVLLSCEPGRDIPRLVQLIKGSLSRALSVAAGDNPAVSARGEALGHHKWWARQYSFLNIGDRASLDRVLEQLMDHQTRPTALCSAPHGWNTIRLE
ncbi:MAG: transposase [Planctomycetes bacterium]|nr:transposase [Planctomycetota bacterium]